MKNIILALTASIVILPAISFAQTAPQAPASWVAFQQQENAKRIAFIQEMKAEREAFLQANPEVKAYFDQVNAVRRERLSAWRAAHPRRISTP